MKDPRLFSRRGKVAAIPRALMPSGIWAETQSIQDTMMKIEFCIDEVVFTATLYDNASAHDLASMLPLELSIEDYSNNEKIAYLLRKLTDSGRSVFRNESIGDLCYYAP